MNIPIMVRSEYCNLNKYPKKEKDEHYTEVGAYFIVNGSEKNIIPQDRMVENKPLVFSKKESGVDIYTIQVNSKSFKPHGATQIITMRPKER